MKIMLLLLTLLAASSLAVSQTVRAQSTVQPRLRILFPAYANPAGDDGRAMWLKLVELSKKRPAGLEIDIIFNPASGPGEAIDPNYLTAAGTGLLADVQGFRVLGYVPTSYGKRHIDEVKRDIDKYAKGIYSGFVFGIFFDEMSADLNTATYYQELSQYAHVAIKTDGRHTVLTVSNPGIGEVQPPITDELLKAYATAMDRIVVFENEAKLYRTAKPAAVAKFLTAENLVHIVHSQPAWSPELVPAMQRRGVANLFITDDLMENPYNKLPSYFDQLCAAVAAANDSH